MSGVVLEHYHPMKQQAIPLQKADCALMLSHGYPKYKWSLQCSGKQKERKIIIMINSSVMYLTVADVTTYLNISKSQAYELTHRTDFPVCRFGGSIRIPRDLFLLWVEQQTYVPANIVA